MSKMTGIIFVHGLGAQRKSQTLLDFTAPLLKWLQQWDDAKEGQKSALAIGTSQRAAATNAVLGFTPFDAGDADRPSQVTLRLANGDHWICTELWWASSTLRPGYASMLLWTFPYLWDVIAQLRRSTLQHLSNRHAVGDTTQPPCYWLWLDSVYALGVTVLYTLGGIAGLPLLALLIALAQIPIPVLQNFALTTLIRPFMEINVAEFRVMLEDDVQVANISTRLARLITWLTSQGCAEVIVVAHSEGAVISFGMLSDPAFAKVSEPVTKLITLGAGLNKAWLIAKRPKRLQRPLHDWIHWLDIWASYDLVPAGWLDPPRLDRHKPDRAAIFRPSTKLANDQHYATAQRQIDPNPYAKQPDPIAKTEPVKWPVSLEVANVMSLLADHGAYLANDEQVVIRLAAEIDTNYYKKSRFWPDPQPIIVDEAYPKLLKAAIDTRIKRVSILAYLRMLAVCVWLLLTILMLTGQMRWIDSPTQRIAALFGWLHDHLGPFGAPFGGLQGLPTWVLEAALIVVVVGSAFKTAHIIWDTKDRAARKRSMEAIATAS